MFVAEDATLVEVNPLALTPDGQVLALDGKVTLDDNADFRQQHAEFDDITPPTRWRPGPKSKHLNYVKLDGRSASSATAPDWSCPPWTWWPTPASRSAGSSRPTSSTSAAAPRPR
jgi:hypothetical protein